MIEKVILAPLVESNLYLSIESKSKQSSKNLTCCGLSVFYTHLLKLLKAI